MRFFDPNCYLYLSRSMDWFDLAEYADGDVLAGLAKIRVEKALAIGANTDILFPVQQQQQVADGLRAGGADAHSSDWSHRRVTTPSWSISSVSAPPCAASSTRCKWRGGVTSRWPRSAR